MPKRMTKEQWAARAEALEEAAGHLELDWTEDPIEREQGDIVTAMLRKMADEAFEIADNK